MCNMAIWTIFLRKKLATIFLWLLTWLPFFFKVQKIGDFTIFYNKYGYSKHLKSLHFNCNHTYDLFAIVFFGNVWTSHLGFFWFVLSTFWLDLDSIYSIILKNSTNIEKFEHLEYVHDKIIHITEFEILNI